MPVGPDLAPPVRCMVLVDTLVSFHMPDTRCKLLDWRVPVGFDLAPPATCQLELSSVKVGQSLI